MIIRFVFDVEAQDLHKEGFAYGYAVALVNPDTDEFVIVEQGECYSIEGAQNACDWVKENVIPFSKDLHPYLKLDINTVNADTLPNNIVRTNRDLRDKFYNLYKKYHAQKAEFWSDVNFPVETNFLSAIVKDCSDGSRDFEMPYPLLDLANLLDVNINRRQYCAVEELVLHNPLDDALTILHSLQRIKKEIKESTFKLPAIIANTSASKLRFVFDIGAQDLHLSGFTFGYIVTLMNENELKVIEQGQCYSIDGAKNAKEYVRNNALPSMKMLTPYLDMDEKTLIDKVLPNELVWTTKDLRERFYSIYQKWRSFGAEVYSSDVNFPVETNFLSEIVQDGDGSRDWEMPYPLQDVSSLLPVNISRVEYTGLKDLAKSNPLCHAISSSCALHMAEAKIKITLQNSITLEDRLTQIRSIFQKQVPLVEPTYSYTDTLRIIGSPILTNTPVSNSALEQCQEEDAGEKMLGDLKSNSK